MLFCVNSGSWSSEAYFTKNSDAVLTGNQINTFYSVLGDSQLNYDALAYAYTGYTSLVSNEYILVDSIITIIDYTLPSTRERFFVIDVKNKEILYKTLVAHGRNSGSDTTLYFSNNPRSYQSSLGFFVTGNTYNGSKGYSLQLIGLEPGYNDRAKERSIVIHGADYVSYGFISHYGRLGRSLGCPAIPVQVSKEIIERIKGGTLLFAYFHDMQYLHHSEILNNTFFSHFNTSG